MINELHELSLAMQKAGVTTEQWHRKYKLIPKASDKAPCVRIILNQGRVVQVEEVDPALAAHLRKFGTNQGSFPCMNLQPLYRVADEEIKKTIQSIVPEQLDDAMLERIRSWCSCKNWSAKFKKKYRISMSAVPDELRHALEQKPLPALTSMLEEAEYVRDADRLHEELHRELFGMLERRENSRFALRVLFHLGSADKAAEDDTGTLSIALDSMTLADEDMPAVSIRFTRAMNLFLQTTMADQQTDTQTGEVLDAFGIPFVPLEEPMPNVKLAGGFDVTLRTMFHEQRCQYRYGRIENASYPVSPQSRAELQAALSWLSAREHQGIHWTATDKNEILFVYPHRLPKRNMSFVDSFKYNGIKSFEEAAAAFLQGLLTQENADEKVINRIQCFILRKIDKARTKVVYSRTTDSHELAQRAEAWHAGCVENLPLSSLRSKHAPYPLEVADILNHAWKRDGTQATDRFKPTPKLRGMTLFLDEDVPVRQDLHTLVTNATVIAPYLAQNMHKLPEPVFWKARRHMALMGLILYRLGVRKEQYMSEYPFLYGQLLKACDELHMLYCKAERKGSMPSQLVAGSLYQAAVDMPVRTLNLLCQRMMPYITWAKVYRARGVQTAEVESWRAGWLLKVFENTAGKLHSVWSAATRLNDEEKALVFIGYMAAFQGEKSTVEDEVDSEEEEKNHD